MSFSKTSRIFSEKSDLSESEIDSDDFFINKLHYLEEVEPNIKPKKITFPKYLYCLENKYRKMSFEEILKNKISELS